MAMMTLRLAIIAALLMAVAPNLPGCSNRPAPLTTDPDLVAFVTGFEPEGRSGSQVALESHADKLVSRYIVDVTDDTAVFVRDGETLRPASLESLELKHWVQVWFDGPLTASDPQEGTAAQLVILGFRSQ